jgi:chromate transporter
MTPGINLIALTILVGRRCGAGKGIALALVGLLLPSCIITVLIAAVYAHYQGEPGVRAAIGGIIPATVALGMIMAWQTARPLMIQSRREGPATLAFSLALLASSAALVGVAHLPVIAVLLGAGGTYAALHAAQDAARRRRTVAPEDAE